jgi:type I restriction enzyme S subunit
MDSGKRLVPLWSVLKSREEFGTDLPLLTVVSSLGVRLRDLSEGRSPSEDLSGYRVVRKGDLVVNKLWARFGAYGVSGLDGLISPAYWVLTVAPPVEPRYLHYLLRSSPFRAEVWRRSKDMPPNGFDLPWDQFRSIRIPVPLAQNQRAIAAHLDAETARIDILADRYRRLIDLEVEKRMASSVEGVEGRFISVGRRASRLAYLRTVPEHWDEVRLSLLAKLGSGHTPSREHPEWWVDATIPWITTGEVSQVRDDRVEYVSNTRENVSELGIANSAAELHPADTVFLSRTASAGFSGMMAHEMATSQDFVTWTCGPRLRPRFLLLCLRAMRGDLLGRLAMGSTHKTIYFPDIQSIKVPLPPVEEQDQIVDWVWTRLRAIDAVVSAIHRQVSLLQERRQAVITAVVTGHFEIPGVAA